MWSVLLTDDNKTMLPRHPTSSPSYHPHAPHFTVTVRLTSTQHVRHRRPDATGDPKLTGLR